jgi:hypothetical protein
MGGNEGGFQRVVRVAGVVHGLGVIQVAKQARKLVTLRKGHRGPHLKGRWSLPFFFFFFSSPFLYGKGVLRPGGIVVGQMNKPRAIPDVSGASSAPHTQDKYYKYFCVTPNLLVWN